LFGYLCSIYCRNQAIDQNISIPVCPHQTSVTVEKEHRAVIRGSITLVVAAVVVITAWIYYSWVANVPKLAFSLPLAKGAENSSIYHLAAPGRLISLEGRALKLFDLRTRQTVWTVTMDSVAASFSADAPKPELLLQSNSVWVLLPTVVRAFDLKTGARLQEIPLATPAGAFTHDDQSILVAPAPNATRKLVERIDLSSGQTQTEEIHAPPPTKSRIDSLPLAQDRFIWAGVNAAEIQARTLHPNIVYVPTMRPKGRSILNSDSVNAGQGLDFAREMANDAQREKTGGVRAEDRSVYQITLHRWFASDTPDWTAQVTGPPAFFPLKTVDLLVSGSLLQVFDKSNKKLWEDTLTYGLRDHAGSENDPLPPPCLERNATLYLADKGMLTALDLKSGQPRWRMPSVGISAIKFGQDGLLYVDTTVGTPELIEFPQDLELRTQAQSVVLQVDPATGRIIWHFLQLGAQSLLSGKFVYVMKTELAMALLHQGEGERFNFNLYRINRSTAGTTWSYYQPKPLLKAEARDTWLLLQFPDEFQVFNFFSL
jgi:hypothetical protein